MDRALYKEIMSLFLKPIATALEIESDERLDIYQLEIGIGYLHTNILLHTKDSDSEEIMLSLYAFDGCNKIFFSIFHDAIESEFLRQINAKAQFISERLPNVEINVRHSFACSISKEIAFSDDCLFVLKKPGLKEDIVIKGNCFNNIPNEQTSNFGASATDNRVNLYEVFYVDTIVKPKNALNTSVEKPQLKFLFSLNYGTLKQYCKPAWEKLTK